MLSLLEAFSGDFGPARLFGYVSVRAVGAALTAFLLMLLVMPDLIAWLRRRRLGEAGGKGDGAELVDAMRDSKSGTPTMGGLGLIACIAASAVLWCSPYEGYTWLLLLALLGFGSLGLIDDRAKVFAGARGLSKRGKILLQLAVGLACGLFFVAIDQAEFIEGIRPIQKAEHFWVWSITARETAVHHITLPFMSAGHTLAVGAVVLVIWSLVVTFACSNSVNFTDGMDGLAGGVMVVAATAFMVIAYLASHFVAAHYLGILHVPGSQEVAVFCAAIAGGCLGFLWFNAAPAQVFMGDTGSQALGGALAMVSLCTKQEFLILLVGFVFFLEGASVLVQVVWFRATGGRRLLRCAPLHHHFQYLGWPETRIVFRFWVLAVITAIVALATLKLR